MQPVAESVGAYTVDEHGGSWNLKGQVPASISFKKEAKSVMELTPDGPIPKLSKDGVPIFRDVEYVTVRQPGNVDSIIYELDKWLNSVIPSELQSGRLHPDIAEYYRKAAKRFREGQEIPIEGTPIKTWPVLTPAQAETVLGIHVRTVEELANLADDGVRRLGMGGMDLKNKAKAWLAAAGDKGKLAHEMAAIQKKNELQENTIKTLQAQLDELVRAMNAKKQQTVALDAEAIDVSDLMDEPQPKRKRS
jgi:hypothetical protein